MCVCCCWLLLLRGVCDNTIHETCTKQNSGVVVALHYYTPHHSAFAPMDRYSFPPSIDLSERARRAHRTVPLLRVVDTLDRWIGGLTDRRFSGNIQPITTWMLSSENETLQQGTR